MKNVYEKLAEKLNALPNGFPPAADGVHLCLLEKIFTPEQAEITALLTSEPETITERYPPGRSGTAANYAATSRGWPRMV